MAQFWDKVNFRGKTFAVDITRLIPNLNTEVVKKNDLASLKVNPGFRVNLYNRENYQGESVTIRGPREISDLSELNFKNKAGSLQVIQDMVVPDTVSPILPLSPIIAQFWDKINYGGRTLILRQPRRIPNLNTEVVKKNDIASLQVTQGYRVSLFNKENFQGEVAHITGPRNVPNLDTYNFRNKAGSLIVSSISAPAPQPTPIPSPVPVTFPPDGSVVRCATTRAIYKIENGKKRHYTASVYKSWGSPSAQNFDCDILNRIPDGTPMPQRIITVETGLPAGVNEGDVVRCATTGAIYKIEGGKKRHYTASVYTSWGRPPARNIDCALIDSIPIGNPMTAPKPTPVPTPRVPVPTPKRPIPSVPSIPTSTQALLFTGENFTGEVIPLRGPTTVLTVERIGFPDDRLRSLRVGSDLKAELYRDENLQTLLQTVTGDVPDLGSFRDVVSSIRLSPIQPTTGVVRLAETMNANKKWLWIVLIIVIILIIVFIAA